MDTQNTQFTLSVCRKCLELHQSYRKILQNLSLNLAGYQDRGQLPWRTANNCDICRILTRALTPLVQKIEAARAPQGEVPFVSLSYSREVSGPGIRKVRLEASIKKRNTIGESFWLLIDLGELFCPGDLQVTWQCDE